MRIAVILSTLLHLSVFALSMLEASEIDEEETVQTVAVAVEMIQLDEELKLPPLPSQSEEDNRPPPAPTASRYDEPMNIPEPEPLPPEEPPPPPPVQEAKPPPPAPEVEPPPPVQQTLPEEPPDPAPTAEKEPILKPEPVVEAPGETVSPPEAPRKPAPKLQNRPKPSRKPVGKAPRLAKKPQVSSASFTESLLRNLDDETGTRNDKAHKDHSELSSIDRDRLAARLGDAIQSQLKPCWNIPAGAKDAANMKVAIHIRLNPDGSLNGQPRIADTGRMQQDSFFKAVAESALRALRNPDCVPFRLPFDKYGIWRQISTLVFNPRHGLGG